MARSLLIFLFLSSCSVIADNVLETARFYNSEKFLERFPSNKKSIIILKYSAKSPKDYLLWCPAFDLDDHIVDSDNCRKTYAFDSYKILMFEPGIYRLSEYEFAEDQYIFQKPKKKFSTKSLLNFKADVSEVIYAGFIKENGTKHEVIDEFALLKNALATKNYQELSKLFSHPIKDLEWLVTNYHKSPKSFVKELFAGKKFAVRTEESLKSINNTVCSTFCDRELLRKREKEIEIDREKYSKKYLERLIGELNSDKKKCGIKVGVKNVR